MLFFLAFYFFLVYNTAMEKSVREPRQGRAIEKKNKIISAAYEVFAEVGYYGANTTDIAKRAGVSTGIVYGYFKDKRDILLYVLDIYIGVVASPIMDIVSKLSGDGNFDKLIPEIVDATIDIHKKNEHLHDALHSFAASDKEVNEKFILLEDHINEATTKKLVELNVVTENMSEKIHLSMNLIQSYAHECVYDKHDYIDYEAMRKVVCDIIIGMFEDSR